MKPLAICADEPFVTIRRVAARILLIPLWMLLAGLGGALLLEWAPGARVDERELDMRYGAAERDALRQVNQKANQPVMTHYVQIVAKAAAGDFGESRLLGQPVGELLASRSGETAWLVAGGLAGAWTLAAGLAGAWMWTGSPWLDRFAMTAGSLVLALPSAVIGLFFLHARWPAAAALSLVLFPRLYSYLHHTLTEASRRPHVWLAMAKGLTRGERFGRHILPHAMPALWPVAGLSVSMALGAVVPLEVLCDRPGIGQLAWQSAVGRDLPVLVGLTWVVAGVTLVANAAGDLASEWSAARLHPRGPALWEGPQ